MNQRGDTIIEVLFAVTVFSLVAVTGISLMNQGTAMAQRSLEISLVRDQMDAQADALRYMHNSYIVNSGQPVQVGTVSVWKDITDSHSVAEAQKFSDISDSQQCLPTPPSNMFSLDIKKLDGNNGSPIIAAAAINKAPSTYAQIQYSSSNPVTSDGIWIEAVHSPINGSIVRYYDFYIRACWLSPGQSAPVTLGTVVRLYDPGS